MRLGRRASRGGTKGVGSFSTLRGIGAGPSTLEELQGNEAIAGAMALRSIVLVQKESIVEDAERCGEVFAKVQQAAASMWPPANVLLLATASELGRKVDPGLASKVLGVDLRA